MGRKRKESDVDGESKFLIDSIERPTRGVDKISITCNGQGLNVTYDQTKTFDVPEKGKFQLLGTRVESDNEQFVLLNFSNPIDQNQTLEGLIDIGGLKDLKYIVNNNQVLVYPNKVQSETYTLTIGESVKDTKGQTLGTSSEHSIVFNEFKPEVRFSGNGTILPSTNGLSLPFETVNLMAVDVKIIKIYENNVLQF